jgi:SAM-dependent methyltransferase
LTDSAWTPLWDDIFAANPWGRYPPEELVVFVARTFGRTPDRSGVRLLEIGCGPGANVWFMAREGYSVSGIDGSKIAIERAGDRLRAEGLAADLRVGDMAMLPFADASFDAVIDVGSVQHNRVSDQRRIVSEALRVLTPAGRFFGIMLASGSWGEGSGREVDPGTFDEMTAGPAVGCGITHYFTEKDLAELFGGFASVSYERRERTLFERKETLAHWLVTASR